MKFRFIWIGKTKHRSWLALQEDYLSRLSHFVRCEICEVRESAAHDGPDIEGKRILTKLNQTGFTVLLDVKGRTLSSPELANEIDKWQQKSIKEVSFVIGGASGVSSEVGAKADFRLSLSFLTFTHEMARIVLLEQLYRGYTILKGFPYQK